MAALAYPEPRLEGGDADVEQRVLENVQIALHRGARDAAVACDAGSVDDLAVVEGGDRQEPRKSREVSDQPFGPDLLAQVEPDIALQYRAPLARDPDQRDGSRVEGGIEIEIVAKLRRGQGMRGLV